MGLLCCFCCGHQREVTPIKRKTLYFCSNCGAKQIRIIFTRRHANNISWSDRDGIDAKAARHATYGGLRRYAEHRGYKINGWCANKFKQIFGQWPNGESTEPPQPADTNLLWWIRKQNAEYRKQKRGKELLARGPSGGGSGPASPLMNEDDWGTKW